MRPTAGVNTNLSSYTKIHTIARPSTDHASDQTTESPYLLLGVEPRLATSIRLPRKLHWDWNSTLKKSQIGLASRALVLSEWNNDATFPIATVELCRLQCAVLR